MGGCGGVGGGCQLYVAPRTAHKYGNRSLVMIVPYLTNDLMIDKKHEGQHQTNPKHQIRRFQQIFKINCDPHSL